MNWQPIETAPKDGTLIDLWAGGERVADCKWMSDGFYSLEEVGDFYSNIEWTKVDSFNGTPTHWMPLPDPPTVSQPLTAPPPSPATEETKS